MGGRRRIRSAREKGAQEKIGLNPVCRGIGLKSAVTESPINRPEKNQKGYYSGKKSAAR
jgi:hypothetical protein